MLCMVVRKINPVTGFCCHISDGVLDLQYLCREGNELRNL